MWLSLGAPEDPEDETAMEMHGADALNSAVKSLMHAIRTEDEEAQQDAAHWMIQIAKRWPSRRCSVSKLQMGNHWFGYQRRMHTLLISNGLKKKKQN
jgi:hypothetical protein